MSNYIPLSDFDAIKNIQLFTKLLWRCRYNVVATEYQEGYYLCYGARSGNKYGWIKKEELELCTDSVLYEPHSFSDSSHCYFGELTPYGKGRQNNL